MNLYYKKIFKLFIIFINIYSLKYGYIINELMVYGLLFFNYMLYEIFLK